ncbi:MAG TPA: signal peptidase I [Armatimonadota bacterium]|nr:signal peptidase I [Armatimonadota bacterium]
MSATMEWLANISVKWVLVAVGLLAVVRLLVLTRWKRWKGAPTAREFIEAALVAVVIVFLVVRPYFFQAYFIPSPSMRPTLMESDRILVNKLTLRFSPPHRQEIWVFRPPADRVPEEKDYIKRVIGLPGETVEVVPTRLMVDGKRLIRFTRDPASTVAEQNFEHTPIGFTLPLGKGSVTLRDNVASINPGLYEDLKVIPYGPRDRIRADRFTVYVNDRLVYAVSMGRLTTSDALSQWGGDPSLEGTVYSVSGNPRLILVRGRELTLDPGHVLINGRRLDEPYLAEPPLYAMRPLRIPPAHYFMMGDNRNESFDSHAWGPLDAGALTGRAELIFWPPSRMRLIPHH